MNKKELIVERLARGETIENYREGGNSMTPLIKSRQPVTISPIKLADVEEGNIVFCKVRGRFFLHLVKAIDDKKGYKIGNNHGRINGWTKNIFGKVTKIG